jgi:hypothetical protein
VGSGEGGSKGGDDGAESVGGFLTADGISRSSSVEQERAGGVRSLGERDVGRPRDLSMSDPRGRR